MPRTRRFLQVRIGKDRVADVIVYLRRADVSWYDDSNIASQLLLLLQEDIIPRVDITPHQVQLGPQGIPVAQVANAHKRRKKLTKQELAERQRQERDRAKAEQPKEVQYASHEDIKVVYKCQPASAGVTIARNEDGSWTELRKFPHTILLWCYTATMELPADEGFPRPEIIPLAELFRRGPDEEEV